jgi:hypothetical protein
MLLLVRESVRVELCADLPLLKIFIVDLTNRLIAGVSSSAIILSTHGRSRITISRTSAVRAAFREVEEHPEDPHFLL